MWEVWNVLISELAKVRETHHSLPYKKRATWSEAIWATSPSYPKSFLSEALEGTEGCGPQEPRWDPCQDKKSSHRLWLLWFHQIAPRKQTGSQMTRPQRAKTEKVLFPRLHLISSSTRTCEISSLSCYRHFMDDNRAGGSQLRNCTNLFKWNFEIEE